MITLDDVLTSFNVSLNSPIGKYPLVNGVELYYSDTWSPYCIVSHMNYSPFKKFICYQLQYIRRFEIPVINKIDHLKITDERKFIFVSTTRFDHWQELEDISSIFKSYSECLKYIVDSWLLQKTPKCINKHIRNYIHFMKPELSLIDCIVRHSAKSGLMSSSMLRQK